MLIFLVLFKAISVKFVWLLLVNAFFSFSQNKTKKNSKEGEFQMSLNNGYRLKNRYVVLDYLGSGGFGETYLAIDTDLPSKRKCVVKRFKPVKSFSQSAYKDIQARFEREAAVLEKLSEHNNQIPKLYAFFTQDYEYYLVQEYIKGRNLREEVIKVGVFSESKLLEFFTSLLPVLSYVHSQKVIHRDIKPANIILRSDDSLPVLLDFGAVKEIVTSYVDDLGNPVNLSLTAVIGTKGYMAPEQASGAPTYSSDLYSLAMTAFFLITGRDPSQYRNLENGDVEWGICSEKVSYHLLEILSKMSRQEARLRYSSCQETIQAFQPIYYFQEGRNQQKRAKYVEAIECFSKVIEVEGGWADVYNKRGIAYNSLYRYEEAVNDFMKAIELRPDFVVAYFNRAIAYENLGNYALAIVDYDEAIKIKPDFMECYFNKGEINHKIFNNLPVAIFEYTKALELAPNSIDIIINRADAYSDLGSHAKAIADYNLAIGIAPENIGLYVKRGVSYLALNKIEEAQTQFDYALSLQPNNYFAYLNRGLVSYKRGNYKKAVKDFTSAIKLRPGLPEAYLNRIKAYQSLKRYDEAISDCDKLLDIAEDVSVYILRGSIFKICGYLEDALNDFYFALDMSPGDDKIKKEIAAIEFNLRVSSLGGKFFSLFKMGNRN